MYDQASDAYILCGVSGLWYASSYILVSESFLRVQDILIHALYHYSFAIKSVFLVPSKMSLIFRHC